MPQLAELPPTGGARSAANPDGAGPGFAYDEGTTPSLDPPGTARLPHTRLSPKTRHGGSSSFRKASARSPVERPLILLRGASLVDPDTLQPLATLHDDGQWRTADGMVTDTLYLPAVRVTAHVRAGERAAAMQRAQHAFLEAGRDVVHRLAEREAEFTTDEIWALLVRRPADPRQISSLLVACQRAGWIEPTTRHRRSPRRSGRPQRIWRSRITTTTATTTTEPDEDT